MLPITPVDFVGDDHQHTLASILGITQCKWFSVSGVQINGASGRVGDSTIEADGGGFIINDGITKVFPPIALAMSFYDLTQWYIILTADDIATIGAAV